MRMLPRDWNERSEWVKADLQMLQQERGINVKKGPAGAHRGCNGHSKEAAHQFGAQREMGGAANGVGQSNGRGGVET